MFGRETARSVRVAADEAAQLARDTRDQMETAVTLLAIIAGAVLALGILVAANLDRDG